jgi:SM-20-related protein
MSSTSFPSSDLQPAPIAIACGALSRDGYCIVEELFAGDLLDALSSDCEAESGRLRVAGTGRAAGHHVDARRRGDSILWLEAGSSPAQSRLLAAMEALRVQFNRRLMLGLHELEAHYASYPAGAGYARHRDRFRDDDARILSIVVYLNRDWNADDGGELRLHLPDGRHDVSPRIGTVALFLSAEIEHEVLAARRTRRSIAGWFRRRAI